MLLMCLSAKKAQNSVSVVSAVFFRKCTPWSVAVLTVFRRMEFVSSLDTHFMTGSQRNTQCYDWPFS